ncbi:MAG: glycosyltransferase family 2 protein [Thermoprotei archaeon]
MGSVKIVWLIPLPTSLLVLYGFETLSRKEHFELRKRRQSKDYKVVFQITTRGENVEAVLRGVHSALYWAEKYLKDFEVWVVTEEGSQVVSFGFPSQVKLISVPKSYSTVNGTKYKARALNYACDLRKRMGYDSKNVWIYFMDEESVVGEDTVLGIIDFIEEGKGEIGQGLIVYPNFWGRSLATSLADSIRSSTDIALFRVQMLLGKVPWMHGSHVLIRADVEGSICWDFGVTWGEDSLFGIKAQEKGYRIKWLKGRLYEQSPFSVKDFLKQRRRWFFHSLDTIRRKDVPAWSKIFYVYSTLTWLAGLPSGVISLVSLVCTSGWPLAPWLALFFVPPTAAYISLYVTGFILNTNPIRPERKGWKVRAYDLTLALLSPFVGGPLEAIAAWYALFSWSRREAIGFEVVKK